MLLARTEPVLPASFAVGVQQLAAHLPGQAALVAGPDHVIAGAQRPETLGLLWAAALAVDV